MTEGPDVLTPNQIVAANLRRARLNLGLTQQDAADRLAPYLGTRWSKAVWSAVERSVAGGRLREFTADDLVAFSRAFDLPLVWFLIPPLPVRAVQVPGPSSTGLMLAAELVEVLQRDTPDLWQRLREFFKGAGVRLTRGQLQRMQGLAAERSAMLLADADRLREHASAMRETAHLLSQTAKAEESLAYPIGDRALLRHSGVERRLAKRLGWDTEAVEVWGERCFGAPIDTVWHDRYQDMLPKLVDLDGDEQRAEAVRIRDGIDLDLARELQEAASGQVGNDLVMASRRRPRSRAERASALEPITERTILHMVEAAKGNAPIEEWVRVAMALAESHYRNAADGGFDTPPATKESIEAIDQAVDGAP